MKKSETPKKDGRLEKVVVFLLVVLISLLSFSVGVISGKGLSDKEYALKAVDQKYSHALNEDTATEAGEGDLSEEEIQQLANAAIQAAEKNGGPQEDENSDASEAAEIAALEKKAGHGVTGGHAATDSHADNNGHAAPAATAGHAPGAEHAVNQDDRIPSSVKKAAMAAEYTVQVAAYPSVKDAETLSAALIKKGYPAYPLKVSVNGADWYKVSVGSFKNRKEAMDYQADMKKQGVVKDAFVHKLTK